MGWYDAVLDDVLGADVVDEETCLIDGTILLDPACVARRTAPSLPRPPVLVPGPPGIGFLLVAGVVLWWLTRR